MNDLSRNMPLQDYEQPGDFKLLANTPDKQKVDLFILCHPDT